MRQIEQQAFSLAVVCFHFCEVWWRSRLCSPRRAGLVDTVAGTSPAHIVFRSNQLEVCAGSEVSPALTGGTAGRFAGMRWIPLAAPAAIFSH